MRPIVEVMTVNFSLLALDQIMNTAATIRHMSGGQFGVPLVIRMATGAGKQLAAQHSHSLEGWYAHIPGLRVLAPATLEDARGMLWTALEDPDPVLIFENVMLYNRPGARRRTPGRWTSTAPRSGARGGRLADHLWRLAVEDAGGGRGAGGGGHRGRGDRPARLRPLDEATIMASVARPAARWWSTRAGAPARSAEISARIMEQAFWRLDAPVGRVCSAEVPIPYPKHLEDARSRRSPTSSPRRARRWAGAEAMGVFAMPSLGADMEDGTLVEWLVEARRCGRAATWSPWSRPRRAPSRSRSSRTATISSLGERGVDQMTGVIYPPQVALVTFGTPRPVPRVVGGEVQPRQAVAVTLAADHRASDGRRGARFLTEIDKLLQSPEAL
jgi:hypothetical protein